MLWEPLTLALAIPAVVFAGISKGGFGSGASFAAGTILALILDPRVALGIMLPVLILIDALTLKPYWKRWSWPDARLIILGALPGVALGMWLYTVANADVFRLLIGAISLIFVAFQLASGVGLIQRAQLPLRRFPAIVTGTTAGFSSFVSHAGGPPVAVYMLSRGLDKLTYQASTVLIFSTINVLKAVPYGFLGLFTWETLTFGLVLAPFAALGTWAGVRLHRMIPAKLFFTITYVLLTVTGSKLIFDALT